MLPSTLHELACIDPFVEKSRRSCVAAALECMPVRHKPRFAALILPYHPLWEHSGISATVRRTALEFQAALHGLLNIDGVRVSWRNGGRDVFSLCRLASRKHTHRFKRNPCRL